MIKASSVLLFFGGAIASEIGENDRETVENGRACGFYLAPSLVTDQYGIYAGKGYDANEIVQTPPSMFVRTKDVSQWQLDNFAYETNFPKVTEILFGIGMTLPGAADGNLNIQSTSDGETVVELTEGTDYSFDTYFTAASHISPGEELVAVFGDEPRREVIFVESKSEDEEWIEVDSVNATNDAYDISRLESIGHCLTDVAVESSNIEDAGNGLFSKKFHHTGDIVSISPALILPKHAMATMEGDALLINYCYSANGSDVALFPFGLAGMINHGGEGLANVKMEWYEWSDGRQSRLMWPLETLERLEEDPPLYVKFVALRDIAADEEVLINYGSDWEQAWNAHRDTVKRFSDEATACEAEQELNPDKECEEHDIPVFKHVMGTSIFPKTFDSICIGSDETFCNIIRNEHRIASDPALVERQKEATFKGIDFRKRIFKGDITPEANTESGKAEKSVENAGNKDEL